MTKPTDTFHMGFDTKSMPGKILATTITIRREIYSSPDDVFRLDLCNHPLYPVLCRYVRDNPVNQVTGEPA